jgi:hypothetical protein
MLNGLHSKLSVAVQASLKEPISLEELTKALKEMASNKAPGPDGVTMEFYKTLWPTIGEDYHAMVTQAVAKGALPTSVTEALNLLIA